MRTETMRVFKCHKTVTAGQIKEVVAQPSNDEVTLNVEDHFVTVSREWYNRHKPEAGGYFVEYKDGYQSYSPAKAFEEGYTPLTLYDDNVPVLPRSVSPLTIKRRLDEAETQEQVFWEKELVVSYKLKNGFTVTGRGACVDPANFDLNIGRKVAREDAENQLWQLEGYLLQQKLHDNNIL